MTSWDGALAGQHPELAGTDGRASEIVAAGEGGTAFARTLARVHAPEVRVNDVAPGRIHAPVHDEPDWRGFRDTAARVTPLERSVRPHPRLAPLVTGQLLEHPAAWRSPRPHCAPRRQQAALAALPPGR